MPGVGAAVACRPAVAYLDIRVAAAVVAEQCSSGMREPAGRPLMACRKLGGPLVQSACLDVAAAVGGAVGLAPLGKRPRPGHRHRSRWGQQALERSSTPMCESV